MSPVPAGPVAVSPVADLAGWLAALDELEQGLTSVGALEAGGTGEAAPWAPPVGLGAIPDQLAARARSLVDQLDAAHARLRVQQEAVRSEMVGLRRRAHLAQRETRSSALDALA